MVDPVHYAGILACDDASSLYEDRLMDETVGGVDGQYAGAIIGGQTGAQSLLAFLNDSPPYPEKPHQGRDVVPPVHIMGQFCTAPSAKAGKYSPLNRAQTVRCGHLWSVTVGFILAGAACRIW